MNKQQGFAGIAAIIIIIVAIIAGGAYVAIQKKYKVNIPVVTTDDFGLSTTTELNFAEPTTNNSTAVDNSETYVSNYYGFSFQFPSDWERQYNDNDTDVSEYRDIIKSPDFQTILRQASSEDAMSYYEIIRGAEMIIDLQENSDIETLEDIKSFNGMGRGGVLISNPKIINVAGQQALISDVSRMGDKGKQLEFVHNNQWIKIELSYKDTKYEKILDQTISTFKFILPTQSNSNSSIDFRRITYTLPGGLGKAGVANDATVPQTFTMNEDPYKLIKNGVRRFYEGGVVYMFGNDQIVSASSQNRGVVVIAANYGASYWDTYLVLVDSSTVPAKQLSYVNIWDYPGLRETQPYKIAITNVNIANDGLVTTKVSIRYGNNFEGTDKTSDLYYRIVGNKLIPDAQG